MFKMEIVEKKGTSCRRLYRTHPSNRCALRILWFSGQEWQGRYCTSPSNRIGRCARLILWFFLADSDKTDIAHRTRIGRCARRILWFSGQEWQQNAYIRLSRNGIFKQWHTGSKLPWWCVKVRRLKYHFILPKPADGCPKRRFWKAEQTVRNIFSTHFSTIFSPNRVLTSLKSAPFVWESCI